MRFYYLISFLLLCVFFTACINKNGLNSSLYNNCSEYYDAVGIYHHKCSNDILQIDEY